MNFDAFVIKQGNDSALIGKLNVGSRQSKNAGLSWLKRAAEVVFALVLVGLTPAIQGNGSR